MSTDAPATVGDWLRDQRRRRGWTQHQLAAEIDQIPGLPVLPEDVQAYEQGWELIPPDVLARIVHLLRQWPPDVPTVRGVARVW